MDGGSKENQELYQILCSLSEESRQKAVSYLTFLRFVDAYKDKDMAKLLKSEFMKTQELSAPSDSVSSPISASMAEPPADFWAEPIPGTKPLFDEPSVVAPPPVTEPSVTDPLFADSYFSTLSFDESAANPLEAASPAERTPPEAMQPSDWEDHFYMPVRSGRFDSLEQTMREQTTRPEEKPPVIPVSPQDDHLAYAAWSDGNGVSGWSEPTEPSLVLEKTEELEPPLEIVQTPPRPSLPMLQKAMKAFCLGLDDVAFVFDTAASTVRGWFDEGFQAEGEHEDLLEYLSAAADRFAEFFENADVPRYDLIAKRPFPDGEFLREKLKNRAVSDEELDTLWEAARRSDEQRRKFKGATKPFYGFSETAALYSIPLYSDSEV